MTALEKVEALKRERIKSLEEEWQAHQKEQAKLEQERKALLAIALKESAFLVEFFKEFWNLNGMGVAVFCIPNHRQVYFEYRQEDPEKQWYFDGDGTESASDLAEALLGAAQ